MFVWWDFWDCGTLFLIWHKTIPAISEFLLTYCLFGPRKSLNTHSVWFFADYKGFYFQFPIYGGGELDVLGLVWFIEKP